MLRAGGWEQAAHTPWQAQATGRLAVPHPVSPDKLCPPFLLPSLPPSCLHHYCRDPDFLRKDLSYTGGP